MNTELPRETEEANPTPVALIGQAIDSLHQGLRGLPKQERQALLLHRLAGLDAEEIALRLGLGVQAVERNIASAIAHLQRSYFISEKI